MARLFAFIVAVVVVGSVIAQEAQKPKAEDKKVEPKATAPKSDEKPSEEDVDVHKTAERIAENAQKASDRLKEKDPGADTRKIQDEIVKDIDALIKKAQNPPPPMNSDMSPMTPPPPKSDMMPPPMGNNGGGKQPKPGMNGGGAPPKSSGGGGSSDGNKGDRRSRRERRPRGQSPMGMDDPVGKGGPGGMNPMAAAAEPKDVGREKPSRDGMGDRFGKASPKRQNDKLSDLYRDLWGHLPDRMRQEMDLYYREKFMPRYSELLRQYYASLAEQRKKGSEDR